ncbi:MAG TPA: rod shape-determining protein MreC [Rhizomicrobium sp.]|nr:rod shape-determining protein MreC [Rhizomicrobium sp.]
MANGTWKIARGKGSAQLPLAIVAVLAVIVLLAGKAHFLPFDRARAALTDWAKPAITAVNVPVVAVSTWLSGAEHFFDVYSENQRLREENARLRQWQGAADMLQARVKRYQLLLNAVSDPASTSVAGRVIGHASRPFSETIVLNAGTRDHVKPGETVADARGVLGRIYLAGQHTAWVILLTDLNSRVPVSVQPANDQAILAGNNSEAPALEAVAQGAKLKDGQEVVTSGNGGLMPPGLPVGVLYHDSSGFRVALYADPGTADDVRIMDFKQEQMPAPTDQDLPATAAGFKPSPPVEAPPETVAPPAGVPAAASPNAAGGTGAKPTATTTAPAIRGTAVSPSTTEPKPRVTPPAPTQTDKPAARNPDDDEDNQ